MAYYCGIAMEVYFLSGVRREDGLVDKVRNEEQRKER